MNTNVTNFFKNKNVTVLGLGLLGRGTGDTKFLIEHCAHVTCTDSRSKEKLAESIAFVTQDNPENLELVIGELRYSDFENKDFILLCPGMSKDDPYIAHARSKGIPIYMSAALVTDLIYKYLDNVTVIGVTGTRGKSTATMMIHHMLTSMGKHVHLGGNVRGVANLPLLKDIRVGDYILMELDSWQLQGFGDLQISPQISVFTSFLDDHLNYYKGDRSAYFNDKANIYKWQKESDILIASQQATEIILNYEKDSKDFDNIKNKIIIPSIFNQNMHLIGEHNRVLAGLANEVGIRLGLDYDDIVKSISSFKAVDGRLQYLGEIQIQASPLTPLHKRGEQLKEYKKMYIYNDNNATTPDATVVGIEAVNDKYKQPCVLICGGADKGLDLSSMIETITDKSKVREIILLTGTGSEKLKEGLKDLKQELKDFEFLERETLKECVQTALDISENDDVILYSPGFASFSPYFKNEYEKNDEFVRCVSEML